MTTLVAESLTFRLLLIEDNEDDAILIQDMLSQINPHAYQLDWVSCLEDGKQKLLDHDYDAVLLDLSLPDSMGSISVDALQSIKAELPIVILTGNDNPLKASEALHSGAEDYLIKGQINQVLLERSLRYSMERKKAKADLAVANASLKELVGQDPLTGVLNRRGFQEVLAKMFVMRKRTGIDLQALLLDLDDLKKLNEKYGYGVGDMAIKEMSRVIKASVRGSDYIARVGGDEFIVLLTNARTEEAHGVGEKLRLAMSKTLIMTDDRVPIKITCSIGTAPVDDGCEIIEGMLQTLEKALRHSKQSGKNKLTVEDGDGMKDLSSAVALKDDGKPVLKSEDFSSVCQKIFELKSMKVIAYEMLTRVHSTEVENISDLFLLARRHNLMTWVDFQCFKTCLRAGMELPENSVVHINLLPSTVMTLHADRLKEVIDQTCSGRQVCLELSEQQIVGDPSYLLADIQQLKKSGIQIAIDDVGFGHSSLESLILLEPDMVKIDILCIRGIAHDVMKQSQFKRLIKVIEACDMQYIVEGVENEADYDYLVENHVRFGHGYYLGHPEKI